MFRIPIIKVKSVGEGYSPHIVGSDTHDSLYIDPHTGGIHYHNIQCCASTQKVYEDGIDPDYGFEFQGEEGYFHGDMEIEFVTLEEFMKIVEETEKEKAEQKKKFDEMMQKMWDEY